MPRPDTLAAVRDFAAERGWHQAHSPENLAKSISIEAAELLECFQWTPDYDADHAADELADVLTYCIHLADRLGVDIDDIVLRKLEKTRQKYPVELQGTAIPTPVERPA
ncbi:nucleotide pyrophosphohydrolase [Microbacterium sp. H1-D42]|uniref:nucleotide pyrophosphohydrolase n=1 Tax=Microbacterium sp. H1-D42 TaxID=2925844 RepID=UPI001F53C12B|nr:nucleotide pyrophosphohydrolase [Microbacterium sp. H1-D42]UNK70683.1 nucleotide pyrophosphohydrolase [Microbacterium sp. H1-D42]